MSAGAVAVHDSESGRLKARTKSFAVRVIKLFKALPHTPTEQVLGKQLLRAGTSVSANYRAACRARSKAEFVSKIALVAEEADECVHWIELMIEADLFSETKVGALLKEARELSAIFTASYNTARAK